MYLYFYPIPRKTVWEGFNGVIHCPYVFFQAIHLNALLSCGVRSKAFAQKKNPKHFWWSWSWRDGK